MHANNFNARQERAAGVSKRVLDDRALPKTHVGLFLSCSGLWKPYLEEETRQCRRGDKKLTDRQGETHRCYRSSSLTPGEAALVVEDSRGTTDQNWVPLLQIVLSEGAPVDSAVRP